MFCAALLTAAPQNSSSLTAVGGSCYCTVCCIEAHLSTVWSQVFYYNNKNVQPQISGIIFQRASAKLKALRAVGTSWKHNSLKSRQFFCSPPPPTPFLFHTIKGLFSKTQNKHVTMVLTPTLTQGVEQDILRVKWGQLTQQMTGLLGDGGIGKVTFKLQDLLDLLLHHLNR